MNKRVHNSNSVLSYRSMNEIYYSTLVLVAETEIRRSYQRSAASRRQGMIACTHTRIGAEIQAFNEDRPFSSRRHTRTLC